MRPSLIFLVALSVGAQASWFGNDGKPAYNSWSKSELEAWLRLHNLPVPETSTKNELNQIVKENWDTTATWTQDQYYNAQKAFADVKDDAFDSWSESRLREFLLEQGVISPKGTREQLSLMAKQKYRAYSNAASSFASSASASATSVASRASASASTAIYGDTAYQMSASMTSIAAQATREANRIMDDTKDYVYSTWDDNRLRTFLEEKGVIRTKAEVRRDEMLKMMRNAYNKSNDAVWNAWSDSYIREWLVGHNIIKGSQEPTTREYYTDQMIKYYYDINDRVYSTWNDADLKGWLVNHGIVKSEAQIEREKLLKLMEDHYAQAHDTIWSAWSDSAMREWLIEHNFVRSDAQLKRDELINLMQAKYNEAESRAVSYLVWPDARLRAYLRERGISEDALPTSRPGLLQETRIRWIQTTSQAEKLFARVRDIVNGGVGVAEDKVKWLMEILTGTADQAAGKANEKYDEGKAEAEKKYYEGKVGAEKVYEDTKDEAYKQYQEGKVKADEKVKEARKTTGEKVKKAGEHIQGEL
jgi:hypothetical protein